MEASTRTSTRRAELLSSAIELIADGGLGAITHRSVEAAAGVPHGSVTYWFGSRDGLIEAVVDQLCGESERQAGAIAEQIATDISGGSAPDPERVADGLIAWFDGLRRHHIARLELELAAGRDPALGERMRAAAEIFWSMGEPIAAATGSPDPKRDGRALVVMIDGLLLDRLARPDQPREVVVGALSRILASAPPGPRP